MTTPGERPKLSKELQILVNSALGEARYNVAHRRNDDVSYDALLAALGEIEKDKKRLEEKLAKAFPPAKRTIVLAPTDYPCGTNCREPSVFELWYEAVKNGKHILRSTRACQKHGQLYAEKHGLDLPIPPIDTALNAGETA